MDDRGIALGNLGTTSDQLAEQGKTPMYIAKDGSIAGIIAVADTIKPNSIPAIKKTTSNGHRSCHDHRRQQTNSSSNCETGRN